MKKLITSVLTAALLCTASIGTANALAATNNSSINNVSI